MTQTDACAQREAALLMLADKQKDRTRRTTVGADKAHDAKDFVAAAQMFRLRPHHVDRFST